MLVVSGNPLEPRPTLLFVDQTEARRAEKRAPTLSQGLDDRPRPLSEGLDPPLLLTLNGD